jgi:ribose transport system permease protein
MLKVQQQTMDGPAGDAGAGGSPPDASPSGRAAGAVSTVGRLRSAGHMARRYAVGLALVVLIIVFSVLKTSTFFTVADLQTILTTQAPLLLLATGLTFSLAAGEFDLSIGGLIDLVVVLVPWFVLHSHIGAWLMVLVVAGIAVVVGLSNSLWVVRRRVNSFILTLAMGTVLTGVALGVSGSQTLDAVPRSITNVFGGTLAGVGNGFWFAVGAAAVTAYVMSYRVIGRHLYFTGQNSEVARLCGVPTGRVKAMAFVLTSLVAALAGLVILAQSGAGSANLGDAYTLNAFATVFLGMTVAKVTRANVVGTWLAVLLIAVGSTGLQLYGLQGWVTDVFSGGVLAIALWFSAASRGRPARRRAARQAAA